MPIKSYLVFPHVGKKEILIETLGDLNWCEILPSENKELIVLVTDTKNENEEEKCFKIINTIPALDHLTLVSGFEENANNVNK
ncbi:MAG: hypothetical protein OEX22_05740 [Cyclobacteriaceae bacterium]|nr:hypothetical protein [Cyclobacteriaceae bacterium]